ncbi:MAG: ferritin family protein [Betaproteobacteria bacterium]|nr:ferritin family protein [Betaproteobacteria bacterium]
MTARRSIGSVAELYAHALAMEYEAAERYREFAGWMTDFGNESVARLFNELAAHEASHARRLAQQTEGMKLPRLSSGEYAWLSLGAPETVARGLVSRQLSPVDALRIALAAEERAKQFFDHVFNTAVDPALIELAAEMGKEEQEHVAWVKQALERLTSP